VLNPSIINPKRGNFRGNNQYLIIEIVLTSWSVEIIAKSRALCFTLVTD
jgi:hypothetical protein